MGFGISSPNVISRPESGKGLGQLAVGIEGLLGKAKEQRSMQEGKEAFEGYLSKFTDPETNQVDYEKLDLAVVSDPRINKDQKTLALQATKQARDTMKSAAEEKRRQETERKDRVKELESQVSRQSLQSVLDEVNAGTITPEQGTSKIAVLPDKDVRNAGFSELGRRTERSARIEAARKGAEVQQIIKDYAKVQDKLSEDSQAAQRSLQSVELGRAAIAEGGTGPASRANISRVLEESNSQLMKTIGLLMRTKQGQALKQSQLQSLQGTLRSTFGARPAVVEFETNMSKLIQTGAPEAINEVTLDADELKANTDIALNRAFEFIDNERLQGEITIEEAMVKWRQARDLIQERQTEKMKELTKKIKGLI